MNERERARLYLDRTQVDDWDSLIARMPDKEFRNLTRSTVPLLAYWMSQELDPASEYHFEYTVPSIGRARASHTDLVILSGETATAIEGKSTEPRYETVTEWLFRSAGGREHVLSHWADHISAVTGQPMGQDVGNCVYQMVHRLASLCTIDRQQRRLVYQVFDVGTEHSSYEVDLSELVAAFDVTDQISVELAVVPTALTSTGRILLEEVRAMDPAHRPDMVRRELLLAGLFEFGTPTTTSITARA